MLNLRGVVPEMCWEQKPLVSGPTALGALRLPVGLAAVGRAVPRQRWEPTAPGTALYTADMVRTPSTRLVTGASSHGPQGGQHDWL